MEEWNAAGETEWMEEHTKYALVDPIVRALGWDTADPKVCHPEFPRPFPTGRVDYALFAASDVTDIVNDGVLTDAIIESKYLGALLEESVSQLQRYAEAESPMESGVAVLTDGGKWWIYDLSLPGFLHQQAGGAGGHPYRQPAGVRPSPEPVAEPVRVRLTLPNPACFCDGVPACTGPCRARSMGRPGSG